MFSGHYSYDASNSTTETFIFNVVDYFNMAESLGFERLSLSERTSPSEIEVKNLTQPASVKFIADSNLMIIMRGVPGTGKSTIVNYLMESLSTDCLCSADNFFIRNGKYVFDKTQIKQAHTFCQQKAEKFCTEGHSVVIIDNTNVMRWETDFYVDLAYKHGYVVVMITPLAQDTASPRTLAQRNKHKSLLILLKSVICISVYSAFILCLVSRKRSAMKLMDIRTKALEKLRQKGYARTRFSSPRNTILHVTSKYLGQSKNANQLLQQLSTHIGSIGAIKVTSVVVTKRTIAARVCLDKASQEYYFNDMEGFSGNKPAVPRGLKGICSSYYTGGSKWN
ncbi:CNP [Bugula neritina]|uniref:CNP n=1 Tax=Bugula neritina TaxID=10212 RepID=A0A7J7KU15_BUGNE|nr:CNP [Bugula neritina]